MDIWEGTGAQGHATTRYIFVAESHTGPTMNYLPEGLSGLFGGCSCATAPITRPPVDPSFAPSFLPNNHPPLCPLSSRKFSFPLNPFKAGLSLPLTTSGRGSLPGIHCGVSGPATMPHLSPYNGARMASRIIAPPKTKVNY